MHRFYCSRNSIAWAILYRRTRFVRRCKWQNEWTKMEMWRNIFVTSKNESMNEWMNRRAKWYETNEVSDEIALIDIICSNEKKKRKIRRWRTIDLRSIFSSLRSRSNNDRKGEIGELLFFSPRHVHGWESSRVLLSQESERASEQRKHPTRNRSVASTDRWQNHLSYVCVELIWKAEPTSIHPCWLHTSWKTSARLNHQPNLTSTSTAHAFIPSVDTHTHAHQRIRTEILCNISSFSSSSIYFAIDAYSMRSWSDTYE